MANRYRAKPKPKGPNPTPHALPRALAWLGVPLLTLRLPGCVWFVACRLIARTVARPPDLTGKDAAGRPKAANPRERAREASYRKAVRWLDGGWTPTRPDLLPALAFAACAYGWERYGLSHPLDPPRWAWTVWTAWLDAPCAWLAWMGVCHERRDLTATADGLYWNMRRTRVGWARSRTAAMLARGGAGAAFGLLAWLAWPTLWPAVACAAIGASSAMFGVWKAERSRFDACLDVARRLHAWWDTLAAPPCKGVPGRITSCRTSPDGSAVALMRTGAGVGTCEEWVNDRTRAALTPACQADGMKAAFAFDGSDRTRVVVALCPVQPPASDALCADKTALEARLTVDEARMGALYSAFPGRIRLKRAGSRDGEPCAWAVTLDGSNADLPIVARDWLKGAGAGPFGDWMGDEGLTMIADRACVWCLDRADPSRTDWDMDVCAPRQDRALTGGRPMDMPAYFGRKTLDERMRGMFAQALDRAKLREPASILHHEAVTVRGRGWSGTFVQCTIAQTGGRDAGDYLGVDYRAAFGDAPLADALPLCDRRNMRHQRRFMFLYADRRQAANLPGVLRDVKGDREGDTLLARTLVQRAMRSCLKTPPTVGAAEQLAKAGWTGWRMPVTLEGGVTAADLRRVQERVKSMAGADQAAWEWVDAGRVVLWMADRFDPDRSRWRDPKACDRLERLRMDEAWAAAKATGAAGLPVATTGVSPWKGPLVKATFSLPAGLGVDGALRKLDAFAATAGWKYTRVVPGDADLTLLLGRSDPLPERAGADWDAMRAEGDALPFAVGDDGGTVTFDPHDTAHLLVTGQTMSGKTSAAVTIASAAVLRGWKVYVADPVKDGNDFAPLRKKCAGFATGLDRTCAMLAMIDAEGARRKRLIGLHGVRNIDQIAEPERPERILVLVDEFASLLELSKPGRAGRADDPQAANAQAMARWADDCRRRIGASVSHILTQHRSQGITMLLCSQRLSVSGMDAMPDAGLAKSQLGRLFIGSGDPSGNVSGQNEREANRLIAQALAGSGLPKGRGLYERMGRGLQSVQCWYCGGPDDIAAHVAGVPDRTADDWSAFLPDRPRLVGVVDDEPDETVRVEPVEDDGWTVG